ncbi:MAG: deoxyguanosinetriphosphate triphosphohydrolase [Chloroflexi bacterium]|nr:deoxyguanosinetriphosphate triphosphohydrolase [Chloroflexota bacterium]
MVTREELERKEEEWLAPYAVKSKDSRGRVYPEPEHPYRTAFQRDRERIVHTTAFRRLKYKTQVFVCDEGDHYRTRLSHTLEAAQIARTMARALGLNEDLAEAITLAHDLGHPPFGHAGEDTLKDLMADYGGFEHNAQSLRVVDFLEQRYPQFRGLNLTWEVREGMAKHVTLYDKSEAQDFEPQYSATLEAQISMAADNIAYDNHDLDDGLRSGLFSENDLARIKKWKEAVEASGIKNPSTDLARRQIVRYLINADVTAVLRETTSRIKEENITTLQRVREHKGLLVDFPKDSWGEKKELEEFLFTRFYTHPHVQKMRVEADRIVRGLFLAYMADPGLMPGDWEATGKRGQDLARIVCDYIAGMTDRFAEQEWERIRP